MIEGLVLINIGKNASTICKGGFERLPKMPERCQSELSITSLFFRNTHLCPARKHHTSSHIGENILHVQFV